VAKHANGKPAVFVQPAWTTLVELREAALGDGCTADEFARSIKLLGGNPNPYALACFLKINAFVSADFRIPHE
jgi:hypothetical protein